MGSSTQSFPPDTFALILGASSGFGAATALECARHGMHVIGVHLDRGATLAACASLQEEIRSHGVQAYFHNVNAADPAQRAAVLDSVSELFAGRANPSIRVLLHSLAFGSLKPLVASDAKEQLTQAQIEMTMNVMANSLVYWTQDVLQRRLMGNGGRVFAMTSSGAHRVLPMYGAVSAAKAALESYCRQLAFELGPHGITANAIQAGVTVTPALSKIPGNDRLIAHARARNPLGRLTVPEDVARAIVMMAREEASWINGSVIAVDGGEDVVEIDWTNEEAGA